MLSSVYGAAGDHALGLEKYARGKYDSARVLLQRAYERQPGDPAVQLSYARVVINGDIAVKLYRKIAENGAAPDTLRAEALTRLGHSRFLVGDLAGAATWYRKACVVRRDSTCAAMLTLCGESNRAAPDSIPARRPQDAQAHLGDAGTDAGHRPYYALQVGSFGVLENARKSVARLQPDFPTAGIRLVVVEGSNLYRVRIGPFDSEESAVSFGMEKLRPRGITFRAVRDSVPAVPPDSLR